jgi:hypothetical protein
MSLKNFSDGAICQVLIRRCVMAHRAKVKSGLLTQLSTFPPEWRGRGESAQCIPHLQSFILSVFTNSRQELEPETDLAMPAP